MPQAKLCFDRFHLIKLANAAVDAVRRSEVKTEPDLRGTRWATLKDARDWTVPQINDMHWLQRSRLKTARAWRLKEALRDIVEQAARVPEQAQTMVTGWISWARRSRLEPFKRLGATLKTHLAGIVQSFTLGLSNGTAESINAQVAAAIVRARGFRT
ncbi:transposase, partial [Alcaligenaceae bacterium]|nr:transposase [Alcaligenaceae bacterium]